ncbi:hypothetical protein COCNU_15G001410 [Cocos nucifera]|uniref:Uncharacterized protein n=1 Tax=Cocos nucifera TaxID=13894 RepID=A0A8K0ND75_COCNU|nr:hypothetical protein COCNU_15G001410 [Cocos nucifera]
MQYLPPTFEPRVAILDEESSVLRDMTLTFYSSSELLNLRIFRPRFLAYPMGQATQLRAFVREDFGVALINRFANPMAIMKDGWLEAEWHNNLKKMGFCGCLLTYHDSYMSNIDKLDCDSHGSAYVAESDGDPIPTLLDVGALPPMVPTPSTRLEVGPSSFETEEDFITLARKGEIKAQGEASGCRSLDESYREGKEGSRGSQEEAEEEASSAKSELQVARERIGTVKGFISMQHKVAKIRQWKIIELEEALELSEATIKAVKDNIKLVEAFVEAKKLKAIAETKLKAIEDFRASQDFEVEVTEESRVMYMYRFQACKAQVA